MKEKSLDARGIALLTTAIGAVAVGSFAIGALAIGRIRIRNLSIENAKLRSLDIENLTVKRLRTEQLTISDSLTVPIDETGTQTQTLKAALRPRKSNRINYRQAEKFKLEQRIRNR